MCHIGFCEGCNESCEEITTEGVDLFNYFSGVAKTNVLFLACDMNPLLFIDN